MRIPLLFVAVCAAAFLAENTYAFSHCCQEEVLSEAEANDFFMQEVKPILQDNCLECHGEDPDDLSGGLALTSPELLFRGGESGPAVNANDHAASLLLKAINYDVLEMPPDDKLAAEDIATLTRWVRLGLPWPESERTEMAVAEKKPLVTDEAKRWWAFQKPVRQPMPTVNSESWCHNEIDYFVLRQLESNGFEPARPASKASLIRRATYDLVGLPPTLEEVKAFESDTDPAAYERLIDRLLASPHYGEKWGRHWLDLVRYAESNSFERDGTKPFVWRFRDYVIKSLNEDKPYDQFLTEQLAGDELSNGGPDQLIATGYYRLGQWDDEPADRLQARYDELDDVLATTSQTMLGVTVNCARCHDHKIDPIPQSDYYSMLAFFNTIRRYGQGGEAVKTIDIPEFHDSNVELEILIGEIDRQTTAIEDKVKKDFIPVEHEEFKHEDRRKDLIEKRIGKVITQQGFDEYMDLKKRRGETVGKLNSQRIDILCVKEEGRDPIETHVMIRGNPHVEGDVVKPSFMSVLSPPEPNWQPKTNGDTTGLRLSLAEWIASKDNPLTARVMANRVWQYHFGRGIVRTSSDFGFQGLPPTHPELLDWLASEFMDNDWHLKALHKTIMMSATYQMSSANNHEYFAKDPANDNLWHFDMRRLTAEEIRDSILAVTKQLNLDDLYGPSVYPKLPAEVLAGQSIPGNNWHTSSPNSQNRRSIYVHVKRSLKVPILTNYDAPDADFTCPIRFVTTQPTQALNMINSDFIQEQGQAFAGTLAIDESTTLNEIVSQILTRVMQREATAAEIEAGVETIDAWMAQDSLSRTDAIQNFCVLALNLNEFVYLD